MSVVPDPELERSRSSECWPIHPPTPSRIIQERQAVCMHRVHPVLLEYNIAPSLHVYFYCILCICMFRMVRVYVNIC